MTLYLLTHRLARWSAIQASRECRERGDRQWAIWWCCTAYEIHLLILGRGGVVLA